jgi:GAF domain-containing protein
MSDATKTDYGSLRKQAASLLSDETDALANTANFVALIFNSLARVNWAGVYVLRGDELVLGPFQGKPACIRLPLGLGVCGTAAQKMKTLLVPDVHEFEGHIACDAESRSELVVPLICEGRLLGVLDLDSPLVDRFTPIDQQGVESLCSAFVSRIKSSGGTFI